MPYVKRIRMKKIKCYDIETPFEFHKNVVKRKRNANAAIVKGLEGSIEQRFIEYDGLYSSDNLESLVKSAYTDEETVALQDMYSYSAKKFVELKHFYTIDSNGRYDETCPNCQMDVIVSFDHLVPQSEFPEYSDNTRNLIPCCTLCNGHKNSVWREHGKRKYLNLFLDDIPDVQFLFAKLSVSGSKLSVDFEVKNNGQIDAAMFERIENHYTKLGLLGRYKIKADSVVTALATDIQSYKTLLPDAIIARIGIQKANKDQQKYGKNYWESILKITALNDAVVYNYLKTCVL